MRRLLALGALLTIAACRKPAPPPAGFVRYERERPAVSFLVPESWRVVEDGGGSRLASFIGPADGARPYSRSLGLYFHETGGVYASVDEYAAAQKRAGARALDAKDRTWKGRRLLEITLTRSAPRRLHASGMEDRRERLALIPSSGGFFLLIASAPAGEAAVSDEAYGLALESLVLPK